MFVRSIFKHPFKILLMPLATVITKFAARWQCAISAAHTESEFQCSAFFPSHVSFCDQSCQVKDVFILCCVRVFMVIFHFRSSFNHHGSKEDSFAVFLETSDQFLAQQDLPLPQMLQ